MSEDPVEEWDEETLFIDLPELHVADPAVLLQTLEVKKWGDRESQILVNGKFLLDIVPEVLPGTVCLFKTAFDGKGSAKVQYDGAVTQVYAGGLVSQAKAHTRLLDLELVHNPLCANTPPNAASPP